MDDSYLVIARRYRPQVFADVIGQDAIVRTLKNALQSGRISHAYLFAGSRGTGKTSLARLYAKALNCASRTSSGEPCNTCRSCIEITGSRSLDVLEIDGASHRGIDHIRSLTESASYAPSSGQYKIYLIDEVHMLTKEAFNALLKILEEPPPSVKFFLATTEPHKIPATIISRCQRFNLRRLSKEAIVSKLQRIVHDMNVQADEEALLRLAGYADGGFRDAESLLDQVITFSEGHIREEIVEEVLGIAPIEWLLELDRAITTADITVAYTISDRVFFEGKDIGNFIDDVSSHYRTLLLLKLNASPKNVSIPHDKETILRSTADLLTHEHLLDLLNILAEAQRTLKTAASQRFLLEWLLLNIVRIQRKIPLPLIARKLFELQERLSEEKSPQIADYPVHKPVEAIALSQPAPKSPINKTVLHESAAQPTIEKRNDQQPKIEPRPIASQKKRTAPIPDATPLPKKKTQEQASNADAETSTILPVASTEKRRDKEPLSSRPAPLISTSAEEETARLESLIQFTAIELGATVIKNHPTSPT